MWAEVQRDRDLFDRGTPSLGFGEVGPGPGGGLRAAAVDRLVRIWRWVAWPGSVGPRRRHAGIETPLVRPAATRTMAEKLT